MAFQNKILQKYLPSRKFTFRAIGIACGLIVIYLLLLYIKTYSAIKHTKIKTVVSTTENVVENDTDADGVRDWEEALWGTNPTTPTTFSEPDKNYIEKKRLSISINSTSGSESAENLDATEKLAKEFLSTILALKESGNLNEFNISNLAQKFSTSIGKDVNLPDHFVGSDVNVGRDDTKAKNQYYTKVKSATITAKKGGMGAEISLIAEFFSSETMVKDKIEGLAKTYSIFAKNLSMVEVPPSAKERHLTLINESYNMSIILGNIPEVNQNAIVGLIAVAQFKKHEPKLTEAVIGLTNYFKANGIIK